MAKFYDRRGMARGCLWSFALVILVALPARGDTWVGDSLELNVADAEVVVRGQLASFARVDGSADQRGTFRVEETLKGDSVKTVDCLVASDDQGSLAGWQKNGTELLVCLVNSERYRIPGNKAPMAEKWAVRHGWGDDTGIIPLDGSPGFRAATMDFVALAKADDILKAAAAAIRADAATKVARKPDGTCPALELGVPFGSPLDTALHSMSGNILNVPINELTEGKARQWIKSDSDELREDGVAVLANFKSADNVAALRTLLNDPDVQARIDGANIIREYPVRAAALAALKSWGVDATAVTRESAPYTQP